MRSSEKNSWKCQKHFKAGEDIRKLITKLIFCTQVMLCSMALVNQAYAEEETNSVLRERSQFQNSIRELVFDQTISPQGREFYRAFIKAWSIQNKSERYHVLVYERATDHGANKLWVEYRFRKLYSGIVRMNEQSALDKIGAYAAQAVLQGIIAMQAEEMLISQVTLGGTDKLSDITWQSSQSEY